MHVAYDCELSELGSQLLKTNGNPPSLTIETEADAGEVSGWHLKAEELPLAEQEALRRALYLSLSSRPVTEEAKAFIKLLSNSLKQIEASERQRRRNTTIGQFELAVSSFVASLIRALKPPRAGWVYRVTMTNSFTGEAVGYRAFQAVRKALRAGGYMQEVSGCSFRSAFEDDGDVGTYVASEAEAATPQPFGFATRFRATGELVALASQHSITWETVDQHFAYGLPKKVLVLRKAKSKGPVWWSKPGLVGGRDIRYEHTPRSTRLREEVIQLNEFLAAFEIDGATHRGFWRIFNEGDEPSFDWNKGGRLYSIGDDNYQRLSKEKRRQITIDGEPVCEIDIQASYLTLLYGLKGIQLPSGDPYDVEGIERAVVKTWTTITLGHTAFHTRWPPSANKEFLKRHPGPTLGRRYPIKYVGQKVIGKHPVLSGWPKQDLTVFDLMFKEGEIMMAAIMQLMKAGIPSLPIFDSLLVRQKDSSEALRVMDNEFFSHVGLRPVLKVSGREGGEEVCSCLPPTSGL